jgi:hypothetical protein
MSTPPEALSSELIKYGKYKGSDNVEHESRIATANLEWLITAKNSKVYTIKFDKNFAKKHLYTSSKKKDKVEAEAEKLYLAAGSPKDKTKSDFMAQAQKNIDEQKFKKQLNHRGSDEQQVCSACGHPKKKHETGSGAPVRCKELLPPANSQCPCLRFVGSYEAKRTKQGKSEVNPLAGMSTDVNTVIVMNLIPKATFEQVVSDALIAQEKSLGTTAWPANGEHIKWDFGATLKGCVLQLTKTQGMDDWEKKQGVEVLIKSLTTDPTKPTYQVTHMEGKNAF